MDSLEHGRLSMPMGEAMFTQRSIRRFRPDPIPIEDLELILAAAAKAPERRESADGALPGPDRPATRSAQFGALYREAWWAKRRDEGRPWTRREEIPAEEKSYQAAARLADEIVDAPCIVLAFGSAAARPARSSRRSRT